MNNQPSKKVLLKRAQKFEQAFLRLKKLVKRTGSAYASVLYIEPDGFKLGSWVSQQRTKYHNGELSKDQIDALENLPGWTWRVVDAWWGDGILQLQKFVAQRGNSRAPQKHVDSDGFRLGTWVANRRLEYLAGKLSPDHIVALESLPGWMWKSTYLAWGDAFSRLQDFVEREGSARVHRMYVEPDGFRLGNWVSHAQCQYKKGKLSHDQITALEGVPGWAWRSPKIPESIKDTHTKIFQRHEKFEVRFFCLQELVDLTGIADISVKYVDSNGFRLGRWISSRRTEYHTGRLSKDRIDALESLPGWKWVADPKTPTKQKAAQ